MRPSFDPESFGFLVTDIARLMRSETDRRITEAGLNTTHGEARTMAHIARTGSVRQNVLAERMGIEAMTLSGLVDRLEARGLVSRKPDPADRRAKLVSLTDAADALLTDLKAVAVGLREEVATEFSPEDWQKLNAMLKIVAHHLQAKRASQTECSQ